MRSPSRSGAALAEPLVAVPAPPTPCVSVRPFRFDPTIAVDGPRPPMAPPVPRRVPRWRNAARPASSSLPRPHRRHRSGASSRTGCASRCAQAEVLVRATTVARRADVLRAPRLDPLGRLTFRGRTVAVAECQALVVARLLEWSGEVVADDEIAELFATGRASTHAEAMKTALRRIKDALAPLGLRLQPRAVGGIPAGPLALAPAFRLRRGIKNKY